MRAEGAQSWAEAAELARYAIDLTKAPDPRLDGLLCMRGEALLRLDRAGEADQVLSAVRDSGRSPYRAQALYWSVLAREAQGDDRGAAELRADLRTRYAGTAWARRLSSGR